MSRHRNVRSMNYQDEYDGYDDVYGHSVEDDYCVSPGTAAQFMFNRESEQSLSAFIPEEGEIPEEESDEEENAEPLADSSSYKKPQLSDIDEARLNSCLEEIRNVIGDTTPEHIMVETIIKNDFQFERALDQILAQQNSPGVDAPKPQRAPRQNRRRGARQPADPAAPFQLGPPPAVLARAQAPEPSTAEPVLAQNVARMTFSTEKQPVKGFSANTSEAQPVGQKQAKDNVEKLGDKSGNGASGLAPLSNSNAAVTPKKTSETTESAGTSSMQKRSKQDRLNMEAEYEKRKTGKNLLNLVVIGHVDAGKSTLMGHLLFQLGAVNKKTMHKYEQESKKIGKASFAYAWVLDETEEERSRGVTMDIAQTKFETDSKSITLLDAPGHKDFIPNMITGAAQADVAVLVVNSTRGEFETGFESGGQTREHALLVRSLGVSQITVAVNKMDTVEWSQERFKEIIKKLGQFLKQVGFKEIDLSFIPCSGLSGVNLTEKSTDERLNWYTGPTLLQQIDKFRAPDRPIDKPLRMCVSDFYKGMGSGFTIAGKIEAGTLQSGDKVLLMPQAETGLVKHVQIDGSPSQCGFAGDHVAVTVTGMDMTNMTIGSILCDPGVPIRTTSRIQARVVIFSIAVPLTIGYPVVFHYQTMSEPATIKKLISQLHKSTGEVVRNKPRCLTKNSNAVIDIELSRPICIELYKDYKDLGRFMLRNAGSTIAAGVVTEIYEGKSPKGVSE